jgi:hypothetical protein
VLDSLEGCVHPFVFSTISSLIAAAVLLVATGIVSVSSAVALTPFGSTGLTPLPESSSRPGNLPTSVRQAASELRRASQESKAAAVEKAVGQESGEGPRIL